MQQDLPSSGPGISMDKRVNSVALAASNSNNCDKIKDGARPRNSNNGRRRDNNCARGGHDGPLCHATSASAEPRRQFKGQQKRGQRFSQQRPDTYNNNNNRQANTCDDQRYPPITKGDEFEVGSVFNGGSKKQNINHLLNFQFEPVGSQSFKKRQAPSVRGKSSFVSRPKYNKEQYLQANCQFVVKASGDYAVHLEDPDTLVEWDSIEQVRLRTSSDVPSCPICLYPPRTAKITRCGHVFCWPCILHYLALSDDDSRKCPICYDSVQRSDLKSVATEAWSEKRTGDSIELQLMRRDRNSLFAVPVARKQAVDQVDHPYIGDELAAHSRLVLATPDQVRLSIIDFERRQLEEQLEQDKDEPEACFIEEALRYLSQREVSIGCNSYGARNSSSKVVPAPSVDEEQVTGDVDLGGARPRHASSSSEGASSVELGPASTDSTEDDMLTAEDLDISAVQPNSKGGQRKKDVFYFYQSSDGQPTFLHALNIQMLVAEYGGLESCPRTISGKILETDDATMTAEMRNKLRYLRHLPVTSNFQVCEIKMDALVGEKTVAEFADQIEARKRRRQKRARQERRREKWIEREENRKIGKFPGPKFRIESAFHFPDVGVSIPAAKSTESLVSANSSVSSQPGTGCNDGPCSFARMLRDGASRPPAISRSETFPGISVPENPDDCLPAPPRASFGDALAEAFAQATNIRDQNSGGQKTGGKKKKMKGTKISLTGAARSSMD